MLVTMCVGGGKIYQSLCIGEGKGCQSLCVQGKVRDISHCV